MLILWHSYWWFKAIIIYKLFLILLVKKWMMGLKD